jgi:hypothetical protein
LSGIFAWLSDRLDFREKTPAERIVALYPGRFQPFGRQHLAAYEELKERFGEVCLVTSGLTEGPKNPFNFEEKRRLIAGYGIPSERVVRRDRRLDPAGILREIGFDPRTTAAVVGFGAKDLALRNHFERHFRALEEDAGRPLPAARRPYFTIIHHAGLPAAEGRTLSGTLIRELLGDPAASREARQQAFRDCFGWYDEETFEWVTAKLRDARLRTG